MSAARLHIAEAAKLAIADVITQDLKEAVLDADLVILCTPLSQMQALAAQMQPHLKPGAVVTDVGSAKGSVVQELEPIIRAAQGSFCRQSSHGGF